MNTKNFGSGYVGIKINSISEIMKYNALKEQFSIWNEYEGTFDDDVEVTDDDGSVTEREPTENEKIERYLEAFNNGTVLYAVFHLDCGLVFSDLPTTFQSKYAIGQQVFIMMDNKIVSGRIVFISLSDYEDDKKLYVDYHSRDIGEKIYNIVSANLCPTRYLDYASFSESDRIKRILKVALNKNYVVLEIGRNYVSRSLGDIFSSKEELVKHLMEQ
nr:MAG TPA: hypothetical protein [Caudoviricetes sp.]